MKDAQEEREAAGGRADRAEEKAAAAQQRVLDLQRQADELQQRLGVLASEGQEAQVRIRALQVPQGGHLHLQTSSATLMVQHPLFSAVL